MIKKIAPIILIIALFICGAVSLDLVKFSYIRYIDDQILKAAINVEALSEFELTLSGGRKIQLPKNDEAHSDFAFSIRNIRSAVEIIEDANGVSQIVYEGDLRKYPHCVDATEPFTIPLICKETLNSRYKKIWDIRSNELVRIP